MGGGLVPTVSMLPLALPRLCRVWQPDGCDCERSAVSAKDTAPVAAAIDPSLVAVRSPQSWLVSSLGDGGGLSNGLAGTPVV